MTIFHVLKYQVSSKVSWDEIFQLPEPIQEKVFVYILEENKDLQARIQQYLLEFEDSDDDIPRD